MRYNSQLNSKQEFYVHYDGRKYQSQLNFEVAKEFQIILIVNYFQIY